MALVYSLSGFTDNDSTTNIISGRGPAGETITGSFANPISVPHQNNATTNLYRLALGSNGITIPAGRTLTIRMYFVAASTSPGRYAMLKNMVVKGEALSAQNANQSTVRLASAGVETVEFRDPEIEVLPNEKMRVTISPNPSTNIFTLRISTSSKEKISLKIVDINGRVQLTQQGIFVENGTINFGQNLSAGTYFAEVRQGNERVVLKLIKQL
jgi:hypothetical protein